MAGGDRDLIGAAARELHEVLSAFHDDAVAVVARADLLDQRIRAAVAEAPSVESAGGTVRVLPLSPTSDPTGLTAALAEREDLTGGDERLLEMGRWYAERLAPVLPMIARARSRVRMWLGHRGDRDDAVMAAEDGRALLEDARRDGWLDRITAARQRTNDGLSETGPSYARVAANLARHGQVVSTLTGLRPDTPSPLVDAPQLRLAAALAATGTWLIGAEDQRRREVHRRFNQAREAVIARSLEQVPLTRLREAATITGLRVSALEDAGLTSVADVARLSLDDLDAIPGVGPVTAKQVYAAARQLAAAAADDVKFRLDLDRTDAASEALVFALMAWSRVGLATMWVRQGP
ncbi:MAG: helix-hairpin-helix domain-containing protein [Dermatophilaceae bacterium]